MAGRHRIRWALLATLAIVGAACGSTTEPTSVNLGGGIATTTPVAPAGDPPPSTSSAGGVTTEPISGSTDAPRQRPEGPDAPDFELALGGPGGTFTLSAEMRPTFLVFWAEW